MDHSLSIHLPKGILATSRFGAIMNKASISIHVQLSVWASVSLWISVSNSLRRIPRSVNAGPWSEYVSFCENEPPPRAAGPFCIPSSNEPEFCCSTSSLAFDVARVLDLGHFSGCVVATCCGFSLLKYEIKICWVSCWEPSMVPYVSCMIQARTEVLVPHFANGDTKAQRRIAVLPKVTQQMG